MLLILVSQDNIAMLNEAPLNQTYSESIILSQDKKIHIGGGSQTYNGSCFIIYGETSTFEIC